jgi:hypothetical protein
MRTMVKWGEAKQICISIAEILDRNLMVKLGMMLELKEAIDHAIAIAIASQAIGCQDIPNRVALNQIEFFHR